MTENAASIGGGSTSVQMGNEQRKDKVRNGSAETGERGCKTMLVFSKAFILLGIADGERLPGKQPRLSQLTASGHQYTWDSL